MLMSLKDYKLLCETLVDESVLGGYKPEHPPSLHFLKSLLQQGKTSVFKRLIDTKVASLPTTIVARIKLLDSVRTTETDWKMFIPMIDSSETMIEKIVHCAMENSRSFEVLLRIIPEINQSDAYKTSCYVDCICRQFDMTTVYKYYRGATFNAKLEEKYNEYLTTEPIVSLLVNVLKDKIIPIQWRYGCVDDALNHKIDGVKLLSDLVLISCRRKSLPDLQLLFDKYGKIPVPTHAIIFLVDQGEVDMIDFIETVLDPSCQAIDIIRRTTISSDVSAKTVSLYSQWLIRRGLFRFITHPVLMQLVSLLVKYEEADVLGEVLDQLYQSDPKDSFIPIFDFVFFQSPLDFLKRLVKIGVITWYNLYLFINNSNEFSTDRICVLLDAKDEEEQTSDTKAKFILSLFFYCSLIDEKFCIGMIDRYKTTIAKEYGGHLFSTFSQTPRSKNALLHLLKSKVVTISPSLLFPLFKNSTAADTLREIYNTHYDDPNIKNSFSSLCRLFMRSHEHLKEFSLLVQTPYVFSINFTDDELNNVMLLDCVSILLHSHDFMNSRRSNQYLVNRLFSRLCKSRWRNYDTMYFLMKEYYDVLTKDIIEVLLSLECMLGRGGDGLEKIIKHCLTNNVGRPDLVRPFLILFSRGNTKKIETITSKFHLNVKLKERHIMQFEDQLFILPPLTIPALAEGSYRVNKVQQYPIKCTACQASTDLPYAKANGDYKEYFCHEEFLKTNSQSSIDDEEKLSRVCCPICYNDDAPVYRMDCGHIFCLSCTASIITTVIDRDMPACSFCRGPILVQKIRVSPYDIFV